MQKKEDALWWQTKKEIQKLSSNIQEVLKTYQQEWPDKVKLFPSGKYTKIIISLTKILGFEGELYIYQNQEGIGQAYYVFYNPQTNFVFQRKIA